MDMTGEMREFLMSRRGRVMPEDVGFPADNRRRVPGLRREEAAILAGVSVDYYVQIERGRLAGVSDEVLDSIAKALRLDEVEYEHLFNLARSLRSNRSKPGKPRSAGSIVPSGVQTLLDSMTYTAAVVQTPRLDILGSNLLGRALFSPILDRADGTPNFARFVFLDDHAEEFYLDWDAAAASIVAMLRVEAGRSPQDRALNELIGQLSTRSRDFSQRWAKQAVTAHTRGSKAFHHPEIGDIELHFEALDIRGRDGLTILNYTAEPGSDAQHKLGFLASWASAPTDTAEVQHGATETPSTQGPTRSASPE